MDGDVLWTPPADARETTRMGQLMTRIEERHGVTLGDYDEFWQWSVDNIETFYSELAEFSDVRFDTPAETVLTTRRVPDAVWFPGATLNYAEHVFRCMPQRRRDACCLRDPRGRRRDRRRAAGTGRPDPAWPRGARRRTRRSGRGLPASYPRDDRRVPCGRQPRGDLVGVPSRVRDQQRGGPTEPGRAQGAHRRRRLPLRRQGLRPDRPGGRDPRRHSPASSRPSGFPTWRCCSSSPHRYR